MLGFKLDYLIGTGKTAMVYLALDSQKREVALKLPRDDVREDVEKSNRFASEVTMSLRLEHPHIVKSYSGIPAGPDAHLCLEYFSESSLDHLLAAGRLELVTALRYATQMASAVAYVHAQNIIHQDIKAANIFVKQGNVYLADFGVAVRLGSGGASAGSPFYMAPEIYRGEGSSASSDVYSLGVLIYELLTGVRPFEGDSYEALMVAHLTSFPRSLATRCPELPKATVRDLEKALSKNPEDRPSATEMYASLSRALARLGGSEIYVPPPKMLDWDDETPPPSNMSDTQLDHMERVSSEAKERESDQDGPSIGRHGPSTELKPKTPPASNAPLNLPKASEKKGGLFGALFGRKK